MKSVALLSILVIASLAPALWVLTSLSCFCFCFCFLAPLGLRCCVGLSLVAVSGDCSLTVAPGLKSTGPIVEAHGLSCSAACGIFSDQGLNLCPLHSQTRDRTR